MNETIPNTPYELMGGSASILSLVDRFYFYMDTLPEADQLRQLHPISLANAKMKLFKFLSGWLGGPNLYIEDYGHPRLRQRHFPVAIGEAESEQWMMCMNKALQEIAMDQGLRSAIQQALTQLAGHMVNQ